VRSYKRSCTSILEILLTNFRCTFLVASLTVLQSVNPNIDIVFLLFVLHFTLIIGNVEVNPGPLTNEISNTSLVNTDKSLAICNINIRSIRNKLEFFQNFVDKFDIITVTETHINSNVSDDDIKFESFSPNIMRRNRDGAAGGGLLIYVRDGIGISRIRNLETSLDETIWVLIQGKGRSFLLCNTYRSDYSDNQYWTRLKHAIEMAFEINLNVVITGDTNSDLFNTQNNKLSEIMTLFNFKNVINKPTRITAHSSTLLDPIIISDTMSSIYSDVLNVPSEISDHDAAVA
jgi:hypothetical protein